MYEPALTRGAALLLSPDPDPAHIRRIMSEVTALVLAASRLAGTPADWTPNPVAPTRPFKLVGLQPERVDQLIVSLPGATWLVEADGARGRGLKLPAAHEPAMPGRATAVAVLAHLDAIGRPLDETIAHRPERLAEYLHVQPGDPIAAEHIARLLADPASGLKNMPSGARAIAVLNQRDDVRPHPQAQSIVQALLASGRYERVIVASLRAEHPVLEVVTS